MLLYLPATGEVNIVYHLQQGHKLRSS